MKLKTGICALLAFTLLAFTSARSLEAREEKSLTIEAVMEELATLRNLVEAQQRQIQELRAAVQPAAPATVAPTVAASVQAQTPAALAQEDLAKRVDTLSTNLGGFKL